MVGEDGASEFHGKLVTVVALRILRPRSTDGTKEPRPRAFVEISCSDALRCCTRAILSQRAKPTVKKIPHRKAVQRHALSRRFATAGDSEISR